MNSIYFIKHFRQKILSLILICMFMLAASYTWLSYNQLHDNIKHNLQEKISFATHLVFEDFDELALPRTQLIQDMESLLHVQISILKNNVAHELIYKGMQDYATADYRFPVLDKQQNTIAYIYITPDKDYQHKFQNQWLSILLLSLIFIALLCSLLYRPLGITQHKLKQEYLSLEELVNQRTEELELSNEELKSFAYSVSHDLRGPLRAIDGFSLALFEDYHDQLDDSGKDYIHRIRKSSQRMAALIDSMLVLSRVSQAELHYLPINLSHLAQHTITQLKTENPERHVEITITPNMMALGDPHLIRQVIENLLSNAWKFTRKQKHPHISFTCIHKNGQTVYEVKDNGAGFNQDYQKKLFIPFQRLHKQDEFEGTGIGLPIVQRIIHRHGGIISAESAIDKGASFYFNLPSIKED